MKASNPKKWRKAFDNTFGKELEPYFVPEFAEEIKDWIQSLMEKQRKELIWENDINKKIEELSNTK